MYGYNAEQPIAIPIYTVLPYCVIYRQRVQVVTLGGLAPARPITREMRTSRARLPKKMACHNSFDVELLYITKTPNCRCLSTKTPEVTTKTLAKARHYGASVSEVY